MVNVLMFQEYGATNSQSSQTSLISLDKSKEKPISLWRALLIPVSHQVKETKNFYILSHQVRKTLTDNCLVRKSSISQRDLNS